nr:hypothetical protein BaRGS_033800 [Batillaria attramentaria]
MEVTSAPFLTTLLVSVDYADNDTGVNYTTAHDNNNNSSYNASQMTNATAEMPHIPTYLSIYVTVFNVILLMTGVVGNVLVIVVVTTVRDMRTPMNWYLVNLSMADLMVLLVCQPAALTEFFARDRWFLGQVLLVYKDRQ